jgi:hypothetical protein
MIRKVLITLVLTAVWLALVAPAAEASLTGNHKYRKRLEYVMYTANASCGKAYLWSSPRGSHTAVNEQTKTISGGTVKFYKRVRSSAALQEFKIYARCYNAKGTFIGKYPLVVTLANTGLPIVPQLLLGIGLLVTGSLLLVVSRKRALSNDARDTI